MSTKEILIVDDSPTTTHLIGLHLNNLGYEISGVADTAETALQIVEASSPDLVLMDIHLGEGMNGIEAADIIMGRFDIPVIYVTSYSDDETLERAKLTMPFGFINKPFRSNDLRVNIEIALSRTSVSRKQDGDNDHKSSDIATAVEMSFLSEALNHLASGIVVIDENLQVYFNNQSAAKILNENFCIQLRDGMLRCTNPKAKKQLVEQINKKTNVVFTINHKDKDLHVLLFPLSDPAAYDLNNQSGSILFLFDTIRDSDRIEEVVRTLYKLSPTEAKITSMLVFNPYLTDISASLGITYNTTRTHLKHIYQKTETNKLSALIQKIVTGPAGLLIHSVE